MAYRVVVLSVMLLGCGDNFEPAEVAEVALSTPSQLLPIGSTAQIAATARDAGGRIVPGPITWSVADPAIATVEGGVVYGVGIGTTAITATVGGVTSAPALVWVARVPEGAVFFDDDQLVDGPVFTGPLEVGARYTVVLDHDPPVGAILLAAQTAPVSGRVVSSEAGTVTVEVVPLEELFVDVDYANTATVAVNARRNFSLGDFECEAESEIDAQWPEPQWSESWTSGVTVLAEGRFRVGSSVIEQVTLRATGTLRVDIETGVEFPLSWKGSLSCKKELGELTFPFTGALAFLAAKIPLGVGYDAEGSFEATAIELRARGYVQAELRAGFEYTAAAGFSRLTGFDKSSAIDVGWGSPLVQEGATIKASLFPYLFAELKVGPPYFDVGNIDIGSLKAGVKGELELTAPIGQAIDPAKASKYRVAQHGELKAGEDLQRLLRLLGIDGDTVELDTPEDVAILKSPEGMATTDTNEAVANQPVKVEVALDPASVSTPDGYQVAAIHILREASDDTWQPVVELPAAAGQTAFEYDYMPTVEDEQAGAKLAVFVETTELPDVLLEIEPDSVQRLRGESLLLLEQQGEIWTMREDGTELARRTTNTAVETPLTLSPDRAMIYFESDASGHRELYRMAVDGSGLLRLGEGCRANGACVSADHEAPNRGAFLYSDLSSVPDFCHGFDADAAVVVDALGTSNVGPFLHRAHLAASGTELLISGACPDIVDDLPNYYGWRGRSIWSQSLTGGPLTALTQGWEGTGYSGFENQDEVVAVALTGEFAFTRSRYQWVPTGNQTGTHHNVYFVSKTLQGYRNGAPVELVPSLDTNPIFFPMWSHDGRWLVFKRYMGGELWRVGNDGTGLQAFTTDCMARSCEPILWTPDGRVVRKVYDPMTGAYVYDVVDPATGMTALLPIPAGATLADWR